MKWIAISTFLMVVPSILSENIFKLDITPEEAQKLIASQNLDFKYAPKISENILPTLKNGDGEFIYQGRVIPNPSDYVEEHYLANQFHGQDGMGRALFGYSDWNQGRSEAINANGDVRGVYRYKSNGKEYIANYWADSLGFHHEDNHPKVVLEPVTDTPAVQKAREEHFRKWKEAAEAAKINPDPYSDVYNRNANRYDEAQAQIDQANEIIGDSLSEKQNNRVNPREWKYVPTEEEATGTPQGFFYKFDYEVPLLRNLQEREESEKALREKRNTDEKPKEDTPKDSSESEEVPKEKPIFGSSFGDNVFELNLSPEEAQKYISGTNLELKYAPKVGENAVPTTKDLDGDVVYMGRKLPDPGDFVEEHYLANQYHGQDGLGKAAFGYTDWHQGRAEAIEPSGDVRGAYKYKSNGREYVAKYWADSEGFHLEDNRPKHELEAVTDTPAVRKAKEEHMRLWEQIAAEHKAQGAPDPYSESSSNGQEWRYNPDEEPTGEPHGFYYNFDYEVPLLRNLKERAESEQAERENSEAKNN